MPFLPFSGEKEFKVYAKFVNEGDYPKDDYEAAIAWNKYVDGKDILPKLPSHLRIHRDRWDRNQRVKECVERAANKNARLTELNEKIAPPPPTVCIAGDQTTSSTLPTTHAIQYSPWCSQILPGCMFPLPPPEAFAYTDCHGMSVGRISIGSSCLSQPADEEEVAINVMGRPKGRCDTYQRAARPCGLCKKYEPQNEPTNVYTCKGRMGGKNGGRKACQYFTEDGERKAPTAIDIM